MKKYITIDQIMTKSDESNITEEELNLLINDILSVIEKHGFVTGGSFGRLTEEEMEKKFKE